MVNTYTSNLTAVNAALNVRTLPAEELYPRTLANIACRAETLFSEGYTMETSVVKGLFYVTGPQGQEYQVNIGTGLPDGCDCPAFVKYSECKHHLAVKRALKDEAEAASYDALMAGAETSTGCDAYARF